MDQLIYLLDGVWRGMGDKRVLDRSPLFEGGPIPILAIVAVYLYFVNVAGPRLMKSRPAFGLTWTIRTYNILMSLINMYLFWRITIITTYGMSYFGCRKVGYSQGDGELVKLGFIYFATKIVELLDTVFFVLRKKNNQASKLHVFHHSFIVICVWTYLKIAPGGSSVIFPYLNTGVHSIMYGYYFLATFPGLQQHLWWKHYLTEAQMIQFIISMVHFSFQGLSSCDYPPALAVLGFMGNLVFLVLFINFYLHAYFVKNTTKTSSSKVHNQKQQQSNNLHEATTCSNSKSNSCQDGIPHQRRSAETRNSPRRQLQATA